jgi:hypothetical protein
MLGLPALDDQNRGDATPPVEQEDLLDTDQMLRDLGARGDARKVSRRVVKKRVTLDVPVR